MAGGAGVEGMQAEIDRLRRRVLELEYALEARREAAERTQLLHGIIENASALIYVKDLQGRYLLINKAFERATSVPRDALIGRTDHDVLPREAADAYVASDRRVLETQTEMTHDDPFPVDGKARHFVTKKYPLRDLQGKLMAVCGISIDVTDQRQAEAEAQRLQGEMLRLQEATVRALSTPLLPIAEGVVVMPLIGHLDAARAEQVLATLLPGIVAHQAAMVIVDVTGVPVVDAEVANALLGAAQAVKLLGAQVVLTGIQPAMARTLVELGANLGGIVSRATLQSGIALALAAGARAAAPSQLTRAAVGR